MQLDVKDINGKATKKISLPDEIFAVEMNEGLLHHVVKAYRANRRQGTVATKTRAFVSGTGRKPFKQKGTGSARQGSTRSPLMPGGAVVHGPQPRDFRLQINAKVKSKALCVALSDKVRADKLHIVDDFKLASCSTKHIAAVLGKFGEPSALLSDERKDQFLYRSSRNIYKVDAVRPDDINAEDVLRHKAVILSETALSVLIKRLCVEGE